MILAIVLLTLIILLLSILIIFIYYILFPSLSKDKEFVDPVIGENEKKYVIPEKKDIKISDLKAVVLCNCGKKFALPPINFNSQHNCFMVKSVYGSGLDCKFACIGLGDCQKVCPQQAISITNKTAVISDLCCGCGKCADICPQQIITLVPKTVSSIQLCSNINKDSLTSCDCRGKEEKLQWKSKKHFKIWAYCYKLLKRI